MEEKNKQLLITDLCARLPYKLHCRVFRLNGGIKENDDILYGVIGDNVVTLKSDKDECLMYYQIKPYLRPMSSMTEEERKMVCTMNALSEAELDDRIKYRKMYVNSYTIETFDLFNSNHLDYRGLIPMGLAIKVTEENNPYKE